LEQHGNNVALKNVEDGASSGRVIPSRT